MSMGRLEWSALLVSTLIFLGAFVYVVTALRARRYEASWLNLALMSGGFAGQCVFLYLRGQAAGSCPIGNPFEILVFVSWSMVLLYFLLGRPFRLSLMGAFTAPLVTVFQGISLPFLIQPAEYRPATDYWLEMHASVSLLAYGAFAMACIAGVMFLVQDRMLRDAKLQPLSYHLPPVINLATAILRLISIGLFLLTFGIASGFASETPPTAIHLLLSSSVWVSYAVLLVWRLWRGLPLQRTALAAVLVFLVPAATLTSLSH